MRHVVVGTAGHIDHGKSALVRALTGIDPDRLKEEKARGITIDLGFAHAEVEGVDVSFVDVPGHERFVKNMLAGATGVDLVLLVVAADESVMPQTREHFEICRLLDVGAGVIALTKTDLVDEDTRELAALEVRELVAGSFLEGAPIVPVSSVSGEGLDRLRHALAAVAAHVPHRRAGDVTRLPVDRVFSVRGFGTVVTGTLVSGVLATDDELEALPGGTRVKVRGLQVHGRSTSRVEAAQRVAVNLAGVEVSDLARGISLVAPRTFETTRRFDAVIDVLTDARPISHGARVRFHQGTSELLGRVAISSIDQRDAALGAENEVRPGRRALVRIRLERPAVVTRGDRFILRAYSPPATIAGGLVIDPSPPKGPIRTAPGRARFNAMAPAGDEDIGSPTAIDRALMQVLHERGGEGIASSALVARLGLTFDDAAHACERLSRSGLVARAGDVLLAEEVVTVLAQRVHEALSAHHVADPLSEGLPREELRTRVFGRAPADVFEHVLDRLVTRGDISARDRIALRSHQVTLSDAERRAVARVEDAFARAGLRPPDVASLGADLGLSDADVAQALRLLQRQKTLLKVETLLFHADALEQLKRDVRALRVEGREATVDVAAFKLRYGVTRKYAIPLLEFLDRERVTRRVGDARIVL